MASLYITDISRLSDPKDRPELLQGLSEERIFKIQSQKQAEKRKQSFGAGLLLREVLSQHGVSVDSVYIGSNGKPMAEKLCFNLSHSGKMVVCAVGERPVGCDVEEIKAAPKGVATRFFSERENRYLQKFEGAAYDAEFFRLWTMKESYVKMTGEGMSHLLGTVEVLFDDQCVLENSPRVFRSGEVQSCVFHEYHVPGYQITVCTEEAEFKDVIFVEL